VRSVEAIRTYDLAKYYGNVKALDGIDLDIRRVRSSQYSGLTVLVRQPSYSSSQQFLNPRGAQLLSRVSI
jgi:hypothetical protein